MKGFKRCSNGHFYKEDIQECPHCSGGGTPDLGKTKANPTQGGGNFDKTQIFGQGGGSGSAETQVGGGNGATQVFGAGVGLCRGPVD